MSETSTINFTPETVAEQQKTLRMVPIDLDNGHPRDARLGTAVQEYAKKEFGAPLVFSYYMRCWAILVQAGEYQEVIGVIGTRQTLDVPLFHLTPPSQDHEGWKLIEQARDMAVYRLHSFLVDFGNAGAVCLVYVNAKAERFWRRFLGKLKAKPADRWELTL
jgi:hypothetical protein